jgi:U3 small nucleolar RNA-associated protein 3
LKSKKNHRYSSDEEEVLAFGDDSDADDSDEDNADFNVDDEEEDNVDDGGAGDFDEYGQPTSWGKKKSAFYAGNKIENEEDADLEEQEAKVLQSKMMKQLDTSDFGLEAFGGEPKKTLMRTSEELEAERAVSQAFRDQTKKGFLSDDKLEKVVKNLSKLSKKEKIELLKQESPELFELVRDFREKVN